MTSHKWLTLALGIATVYYVYKFNQATGRWY